MSEEKFYCEENKGNTLYIEDIDGELLVSISSVEMNCTVVNVLTGDNKQRFIRAASSERMQELETQLQQSAEREKALQDLISDYELVMEDKRRLTKEIDHILGSDAKRPSLCDVVEQAEIVMDRLETTQSHSSSVGKEQAREIATKFFYYWWNQDGSNTEAGFDEWWENYSSSLSANKGDKEP